MTYDQMIAEFSTYEQEPTLIAQYGDLIARMTESAGDGVDGFHERTITRLASTRAPVIEPTPEVEPDAAHDGDSETDK